MKVIDATTVDGLVEALKLANKLFARNRLNKGLGNLCDQLEKRLTATCLESTKEAPRLSEYADFDKTWGEFFRSLIQLCKTIALEILGWFKKYD